MTGIRASAGEQKGVRFRHISRNVVLARQVTLIRFVSPAVVFAFFFGHSLYGSTDTGWQEKEVVHPDEDPEESDRSGYYELPD